MISFERTLKTSTTLFGRHLSVRFVLIGIVNTAFSYSLLTLFLHLGLCVELASLLALIIGILFSYLTQSSLVFSHSTPAAFLRFVTAWGIIYFLNLMLLYILMALGANSYLAGALAIIPITALSYFIMKRAVFPSTAPDAP